MHVDVDVDVGGGGGEAGGDGEGGEGGDGPMHAFTVMAQPSPHNGATHSSEHVVVRRHQPVSHREKKRQEGVSSHQAWQP